MKSFDQLEEKFGVFKGAVNDINYGGRSARLHFIGQGAESSVWRYKAEKGDFAIKVANKLSVRGRPRNIYKAAQSSSEAGIRAFGVDGLEQITASSLSEGVCVYEWAPGSTLRDLPPSGLDTVSDAQIAQLAMTVKEASLLGIEFDGWNTSGGNILYDGDVGFTLIDYWLRSEPIPFRKNKKYVEYSLGKIGLKLVGRDAWIDS